MLQRKVIICKIVLDLIIAAWQVFPMIYIVDSENNSGYDLAYSNYWFSYRKTKALLKSKAAQNL
jgi:hypothetical protein